MSDAHAVYHALFTNAFGSRGQGFRTFFEGPGDLDRERVERWLLSLRPAVRSTDAEAGVAAGCFRLVRRGGDGRGVLHAALATVDAGFARDEHGRAGGFLVHAVLLPLDEDRPAGDFGPALLELLRGFERPEVDDLERLERYLGACRACPRVDVPALDPAPALAFDDEVLLRLFHLSAGGARAAEVVWPEERVDDPPAALLRVAGLLPPRLRLGLRWTWKLTPLGAGSFAVRLAPSQVLRPTPRQGPPWHHLRWLRHTAGDLGAVRDLVAGWHVRSWRELTREIEGDPR